MWGGLGLFLVVVLLILVSFWNGGRGQQVRLAKINACAHAADPAACIRAVKP